MAVYSSELTEDELPKWQIATSRHVVAKTHSMKAINTCLLFVSVLGGLVGLIYLLFDPMVKHIILRNLILTNDTQFAEIWQNPPIAPHLKVYFYNLTNAEEFFAGEEKASVDEVGPYTYSQKWIKENVAWHSNGTMSYSTRKIYTFSPVDSGPGLDPDSDLIITPNVPVISAYYQMRNSNFFVAWGLEAVISSLSYKMWMTKTPTELVWGYEEPLFELAKSTMPNPPTMTNFGYFTDDTLILNTTGTVEIKNNSDSLPLYTMYTGELNPYNLSKIHRFNGKEHLSFWKTDQCNRVQGSDGATYNPYIHKADTLWFFNDQLCRSIPLVYDKSIMSRGLPGHRFVPRSDVFLSPRSHPENDCYCVDQTLCDMIGDGMFPISACQFDAPIVLSWPHFLGANSSFPAAIDGLEVANQEEHGFWFDVQPTTGTTLSAKARLQVNIAIKKSKTFSDLAKIGDTVLPVLWFEEGLDELGDSIVDAIEGAINGPPRWKNYILCTLLGLSISTLVISVVAFIRLCLNRRADADSARRAARYAEALAIAAGHKAAKSGSGGESAVGAPIIRSDGLVTVINEVEEEDDPEDSNEILEEEDNVIGRAVSRILKAPAELAAAAEKELMTVVHHHHQHHDNAEIEEERPMLESSDSSGVCTQESSRATSASHSRNTSTGSNRLGGESVINEEDPEQIQLLKDDDNEQKRS